MVEESADCFVGLSLVLEGKQYNCPGMDWGMGTSRTGKAWIMLLVGCRGESESEILLDDDGVVCAVNRCSGDGVFEPEGSDVPVELSLEDGSLESFEVITGLTGFKDRAEGTALKQLML